MVAVPQAATELVRVGLQVETSFLPLVCPVQLPVFRGRQGRMSWKAIWENTHLAPQVL